MKRTMLRTLGLTAIGIAVAFPAWAQDVPALANLSGKQADQTKQLIAKAEKEGSISYWDTVIQPETNDALTKAFKKYYDMPESFEVNYSLSGTSDLVTKVGQAMKAGNVTMDVASVAALPWIYDHIESGDIMKYESPQYASYQHVFDKGLGKDGYFAFNGAYVFVPMWNADKLDFDGTSYKDVIGAVPEGRISHGDVSNSTSYLSTYVGQRKVLDKPFFKKLAAMKPNFLVRSEQIASRLVSGQDLMAYSGMPTRAYQFNQRGAHLKVMFPKEGVVILPQATFILAHAPHPAAAKLWIDFILSNKGQQILVKNEALMSGRKGFKSPLPDYAPSIDSLNVIGVDWSKVRSQDMSDARAQWTDVFNP